MLAPKIKGFLLSFYVIMSMAVIISEGNWHLGNSPNASTDLSNHLKYLR